MYNKHSTSPAHTTPPIQDEKTRKCTGKLKTLRVLPPSLRACAGSYVWPPRRRPRDCGRRGAAPSASARVCVPLTGTGDAAGVIEESNESNTARSAHMPALPILMQPLHTPSASLHHACTRTHRGAALTGRLNLHTPSPSLQHACTSTHRGAALTGRPQPSGCQNSQEELPADCKTSSCNRHHTTSNQRDG